MNKNKKDILKTAIKAGKERNYEKAVKILLDIVKDNDDIPEAYLYLGRSFYALGKYAQSLRYLRIFLEYEPESPVGHFFIGRSYLASGLVKKSVPHFKFTLQKHPDSPFPQSFMGIALMKMKRFENALKYLGNSIELSGENQNGKVFEIYLNCLLIVAIRKFNTGDLETSKQMFDFYLDYITDKVLPYLYLGMISKNTGKDNEALFYYEKAIELSPDDELLLFRRSVLLYKTGNKELAMEQLNRLNIQDYDGSIPTDSRKENRFLALKYFQQEDFKSAVYFGRETLKIDPSDTDMHLVMAESFRNLKNLNFSSNHYRKAISLDRSRVESRYGYLLVLMDLNDYEKILEELKIIESMELDSTLGDYYKAVAYCKLNYDLDVTIPAVQEQIHLHPSDPFLFQLLGEEYLKEDRPDMAERWFLNVFKAAEAGQTVYMDLVTVYRRMGKKKKLVKILKNFFEDGYFDYALAVEYVHILYELKRYKQVIIEAVNILGVKENRSISRILAASYRQLKLFSDAALVYKHLLQKEPDNIIFLKSYAYCLDKGGNIKKAISLVRSALDFLKAPESNMYLILGVLLYKDGDVDEAVEVFRNNISRYPDDWHSYYNLGIIYKERGLNDFAERFLSESIKRKGKN